MFYIPLNQTISVGSCVESQMLQEFHCLAACSGSSSIFAATARYGSFSAHIISGAHVYDQDSKHPTLIPSSAACKFFEFWTNLNVHTVSYIMFSHGNWYLRIFLRQLLCEVEKLVHIQFASCVLRWLNRSTRRSRKDEGIEGFMLLPLKWTAGKTG